VKIHSDLPIFWWRRQFDVVPLVKASLWKIPSCRRSQCPMCSWQYWCFVLLLRIFFWNCCYRSLACLVAWRVPPFGASTPSTLLLLMVSSNLMPGGVSISSVIPLRGFLPLYSVGWRWVEPGCATKGVTISFKGDLRVP